MEDLKKECEFCKEVACYLADCHAANLTIAELKRTSKYERGRLASIMRKCSLLNDLYHEWALSGGPKTWAVSHSYPHQQAQELPPHLYEKFLNGVRRYNEEHGICVKQRTGPMHEVQRIRP